MNEVATTHGERLPRIRILLLFTAFVILPGIFFAHRLLSGPGLLWVYHVYYLCFSIYAGVVFILNLEHPRHHDLLLAGLFVGVLLLTAYYLLVGVSSPLLFFFPIIEAGYILLVSLAIYTIVHSHHSLASS